MYLLRSPPDPDLTILQKLKVFFAGHWKGVVIFVTPLVFLFMIVGGKPTYNWCGYTLIIMGIFWMTECLPLPITALLPLVIFPLGGVMSTIETASCYINDTVLMFLGSLMLAYSVEQSGLHRRLAYCTIRTIGYSHVKLLLAICIVTTFVSMWITNTAATTMMVPIIFAILRVFDSQGIIKMYETSPDGEKCASDITVCYFCCATYSATVGGIGTLIGTGTNLVFKGLFETKYPDVKEYLSFPLFSGFGVPYMIILELFVYLCLSFQYLGLGRPKSKIAQKVKITDKAKLATQRAIADEVKKMGKITFHEIMVLILFGGAIIAFFCRSPEMFTGWGDTLESYFNVSKRTKFIRDSALSTFVLFLMFLLPATLTFFKNCTAKFHEHLPTAPIRSVLDWKTLNDVMPYSYMFLLGGGFAISTAAAATGMNEKISEFLSFMKNLPKEVALLVITVIVILVTNFASNVAVANVFVPICMVIAEEMKMHPLWACIAAGFSASMCFMLPVGTPGNLIVQGAANIRTMSMVKCGFAPTVTTIFISWMAFSFWAPMIWPDVKKETPF
ncbi:protein I'm not dead yet [Amyelois transitella]|uniref:protein I'm not dead yet n=1 Tax=Amyelois transitella TaxID=680683 RepID=UPI00299058FF|nr:protein I'm not dead yet [Amyelois transitella]